MYHGFLLLFALFFCKPCYSVVLIVFYFYYIVSVVYSYSTVAKKNLVYVDKIIYCYSLLNISFRVEEIEIINSNKCTGRNKMFIHKKCPYRIVTFEYLEK